MRRLPEVGAVGVKHADHIILFYELPICCSNRIDCVYVHNVTAAQSVVNEARI